MAFLQEKDAETLHRRFQFLDNNVKIINFTQELECQFCRETRMLMEEVTDLSDKISLEIYDFQIDKEKAEGFDIDKIPATVVMADRDVGIRFYGIPSGYEFASLLESIELVSSDRSALHQHTIDKIKAIDKDVHIQVFVTPTCPYCPGAVVTAHAMAYLNDRIRGDMVEATEFPHLANKYRVMGVPRVIINETTHFESALPENLYLEKVMEAIR